MSDEDISDSLNMNPITIDNDSNQLVPRNNAPPQDNSSAEEIVTDTKYVRSNMYDVIEKGHRAIDELMNVADQSQHPRAYEVLANMLKTMGDLNKDLIDLHDRKQKLLGEKPQAPESVTNNNLYVGSTADIMKLLNDDEDER